jgi:RNA polymerase sigma-70 factor, ECF subfamily
VLERLRAGDPRAFEDLVTVYQHRVFAVAYRMLGSRAEAEEAAQEVFLRAHRGLAEFRGEAKLSTWLFAITSRLCLSRLASGAARIERARDNETALAGSARAPGG